MQYGRQPETRLRIEQLLAEYYRGGATAEIKKFTPAGITPGRQLARDHFLLALKPVFDDPPQDIPGLGIFR